MIAENILPIKIDHVEVEARFRAFGIGYYGQFAWNPSIDRFQPKADGQLRQKTPLADPIYLDYGLSCKQEHNWYLIETTNGIRIRNLAIDIWATNLAFWAICATHWYPLIGIFYIAP